MVLWLELNYRIVIQFLIWKARLLWWKFYIDHISHCEIPSGFARIWREAKVVEMTFLERLWSLDNVLGLWNYQVSGCVFSTSDGQESGCFRDHLIVRIRQWLNRRGTCWSTRAYRRPPGFHYLVCQRPAAEFLPADAHAHRHWQRFDRG